jgi:hypothetical protein
LLPQIVGVSHAHGGRYFASMRVLGLSPARVSRSIKSHRADSELVVETSRGFVPEIISSEGGECLTNFVRKSPQRHVVGLSDHNTG